MDKDKRIIKTRRIITNTFINLLTKNDFNKITVTAICSNSEISKSTFYDHFEDKFDLLRQVVDDKTKQVSRLIERHLSNNNPSSNIKTVTDIFIELDNNNEILMLLNINIESISLTNNIIELLETDCSDYLINNQINTSYSTEMVSELYANITMASIKLALTHIDNPVRNAKQTQLTQKLQNDFFNSL